MSGVWRGTWRSDLEIKGAEALMARFNPGGAPSDWEARAAMAYRQRAAVVIDAVIGDIREDERRCLAFLLRHITGAENIPVWGDAYPVLERLSVALACGEVVTLSKLREWAS